jgi:WD40 repeat protein
MEKRDEKKIENDTKRLKELFQELVKKEGMERALKKLGIEEGIMKVENKKINYEDFELLKTLVGSGHILSVRETKSGNLASISFEHNDHILKIWDAKTGKCIATKDGANSVIETKSGNLVSANKDNTIKIWDPTTGKCIKTLEGHTNAVNSVIETKSGLLVSASNDKTIKIWGEKQ